MIDNTHYCTTVLSLWSTPSLLVVTQHLFHPRATGWGWSSFKQSLRPSYDINTFDSVTPVFEHKCFTFPTRRQPPTQRQKDIKNQSAVSSWPGSCNLQEQSACEEEHRKSQPFILGPFGTFCHLTDPRLHEDRWKAVTELETKQQLSSAAPRARGLGSRSPGWGERRLGMRGCFPNGSVFCTMY